MKTLCVILARSGSKGLPGKNMLTLAGQPLVAWTIDHAQAAKLVDRVVLSTDSPDIAAIGDKHGIDTVLRPPELASDTATVDAAARQALASIDPDEVYAAVVILYGNVPIRPAGLIDRAVRKLRESGADSVQSVCPVGKLHPYWMRKLTADVLAPYQPNEVYRRQDLPAVYQIDGGVIAVRRDSLLRVVPGHPHAFLGRDQRAVRTEPGQVVDIDTATDLAVARAMVETTDEKRPPPTDPMGTSSGGSGGSGGGGVRIGGKAIGHGEPVYIIAELGVNHDGRLDRALALTRQAHRAGADAVKLQVFEPELLLSEQAVLAEYQKHGADDPHRMLTGLRLDTEAMLAVRRLAHELGLGFIVTCFSIELADRVRQLDVDAVKIASPDAVNLPLIEAMLGLDRPMVISTGACGSDELGAAMRLCRGHPTVLLHCVSAYPVPPGQAALGGMDRLRRFGCPVGYSDHTTDPTTGALAAARGACVIEKHLTHNRGAEGPDHAASFDPEQMTRYIAQVRAAQRQIGSTDQRGALACEREVRRVARQSVCATRDLAAGHRLERGDLTVKRPGMGVPAAKLGAVIGCTLRRAVRQNHLIREEDLERFAKGCIT